MTSSAAPRYFVATVDPTGAGLTPVRYVVEFDSLTHMDSAIFRAFLCEVVAGDDYSVRFTNAKPRKTTTTYVATVTDDESVIPALHFV